MSPRIQVSSDLYVALRTLMQPGDRTPSDVIWRLVQDRHVKRTEPPAGTWVVDSSEGLDTGGVTIPNGLRLRGRYKNRDYTYGEIREGKLWIGGDAFGSPSAGARTVARICGARGTATSVNGWKFWEFEFPKGSNRWRRLDSLRQPWDVRRRSSKRNVSHA